MRPTISFSSWAINGTADMIVSGAADLLVPAPFPGILILAPAVFVQGAVRT